MSEKDEANLLAILDSAKIDAEEIWQIIQNYVPMHIIDIEAILTKKSG